MSDKYTAEQIDRMSDKKRTDQIPWESDHEFDAWVRTLPEKTWAKYDLSACRLGWEAHKAAQMMREREMGGAVEPTWRIDTDDDVEKVAKIAGWNNRSYMTPADYHIWCDRMREFVRQAIVSPAAPRAAVPDGWKLVPVEAKHQQILAANGVMRKKNGAVPVLHYEETAEIYKAMLAAAPEVTK